MASFHSRQVETLVEGTPATDGGGVQLLRVLGQNLQRRLDPFLMLDEFRSDDPDDYGAGFPDHPHRGFETVTYMLAGRMRHQDNHGNHGLLTAGGVQWMTAGRGLVHSEMPEQENGLMHGFQLWLNLPSESKMIDPWYRDIPDAEIPNVHLDSGVTIRVIAGSAENVRGAMARERTEPLYLDVQMPAASRYDAVIDAAFNAFVYVYDGSIGVGDPAREAGARKMALLENARGTEGVSLQTDRGGRALVIAGRPLGETIAQYGPFVMNTKAELDQAILDYREGLF
ncbi:MAG: pirin family protein [Thermoanaerobaculia bacterium]